MDNYSRRMCTYMEVPIRAGRHVGVDAAHVLLAPVDEGGVHGQELVWVVQAPLCVDEGGECVVCWC